jgi:hypothetical protein
MPAASVMAGRALRPLPPHQSAAYAYASSAAHRDSGGGGGGGRVGVQPAAAAAVAPPSVARAAAGGGGAGGSAGAVAVSGAEEPEDAYEALAEDCDTNTSMDSATLAAIALSLVNSPK